MRTKSLAPLTGLLLSTIMRPAKPFLLTHLPAVAAFGRPYTSSLTAFRRRDDDLPSLFKPFRNNDIFSLLDDFDIIPAPSNGGTRPFKMAMDFKESKDAYELIVDLPGVESKDIDIKLRNNQLTISAHRESHKKEDGANYHRVERHSGHITRTVTLPENADLNEVSAENKNGVLHVRVKKTAAEQPHERKIEIKAPEKIESK